MVQVTGAPVAGGGGHRPNLASEIADEQPAATVVACSDSGRAVTLQRALVDRILPAVHQRRRDRRRGRRRVQERHRTGVRDGRRGRTGENTAAAIITRGLAEIMRLGIALGAKPATMAGLAGVGDLVATCTSALP